MSLIGITVTLAVAPTQPSRTQYEKFSQQTISDVDGDGLTDIIKFESEIWSKKDYKLISADYLNPRIEFPISAETPEDLDPKMTKSPSNKFFYK